MYPNRLTRSAFIEKSRLVHGDKYNYDKVVYHNTHTKVVIVCPVHGEFRQEPRSHLSGSQCNRCVGNNDFDIKLLVERAIKIHGDKYDYSKTVYVNSYTKIAIVCPQHGEFTQLSTNHLSGQGCPWYKSSKGEAVIKAILVKYGIEHKQQYKIPEVADRLYYDFYLPEYNLLIEFHGQQHFEVNPFFHRNGEDDLLAQKNRDAIVSYNAKHYKYGYLEFDYKQLKRLSEQEFESMILNKINSFRRLNASSSQ